MLPSLSVAQLRLRLKAMEMWDFGEKCLFKWLWRLILKRDSWDIRKLISKENLSKCLDFGLLNYWIWNHEHICTLLNQGTGTAVVSSPLPLSLPCQYLLCSVYKFALCLSFPTCTSFSCLWAFLFLFLIMGVSMRLWLGQTGKQERRKETVPFEKCFRWRK